ncbi:MAG: hypothetical protein L0387_45875 [Acidobacteria bacterium]|nr:hypothetical protein [Acidobacteriota bacterium]
MPLATAVSGVANVVHDFGQDQLAVEIADALLQGTFGLSYDWGNLKTKLLGGFLWMHRFVVGSRHQSCSCWMVSRMNHVIHDNPTARLPLVDRPRHDKLITKLVSN